MYLVALVNGRQPDGIEENSLEGGDLHVVIPGAVIGYLEEPY